MDAERVDVTHGIARDHADAPGRAAVRRGGRDQTRSGGLPGCGRGPYRPRAERPAVVGDPGARGPASVHAEERAGLRATMGQHRLDVSGIVAPGGAVRADPGPGDVDQL